MQTAPPPPPKLSTSISLPRPTITHPLGASHVLGSSLAKTTHTHTPAQNLQIQKVASLPARPSSENFIRLFCHQVQVRRENAKFLNVSNIHQVFHHQYLNRLNEKLIKFIEVLNYIYNLLRNYLSNTTHLAIS